MSVAPPPKTHTLLALCLRPPACCELPCRVFLLCFQSKRKAANEKVSFLWHHKGIIGGAVSSSEHKATRQYWQRFFFKMRDLGSDATPPLEQLPCCGVMKRLDCDSRPHGSIITFWNVNVVLKKYESLACFTLAGPWEQRLLAVLPHDLECFINFLIVF